MKFKRWLPVDGLPGTLYLEGLHDDYEGFRLLLRGLGEEQRMLRISFDSTLSYRNTDEGELLKTISKEVGGWSLYTVEDSEFLLWFNNQSYGIHESEDIVHYAVYTPNDCVDILSTFSPKVEWLN